MKWRFDSWLSFPGSKGNGNLVSLKQLTSCGFPVIHAIKLNTYGVTFHFICMCVILSIVQVKYQFFFVEWNFGKEIFNCSRHLCWTLYSPYMRNKPRARSNWLDIDRVLFSNLKSQNQTLT